MHIEWYFSGVEG